ncbi:MAG: SRPBCC family protein [Gammaproteobacteria bacterium]
MKKIVLILIVLAIAGVSYLVVEGGKVQEVVTEIEISASPDKVWAIITDINKWQDWSPIINQSSGNASVGSELRMTMIGKAEGKGGPTYNPIITQLEKPRLFQWRAHMIAGFIFTNDKIFELEETTSGTRLVHKETFRGLLAPIFCRKMEEGVPPMLHSMNKALKDLAEQ